MFLFPGICDPFCVIWVVLRVREFWKKLVFWFFPCTSERRKGRSLSWPTITSTIGSAVAVAEEVAIGTTETTTITTWEETTTPEEEEELANTSSNL